MILLLRERATPEQIEQMLLEHRFYIKTAIDIKRRVLAGGGNLHYDCEQALLGMVADKKIFGLQALCH